MRHALALRKEAGAAVTLVGLRAGATYEGEHGRQTAKTEDFDAIIIPGGGAPERLRLDEAVLRLVREAAAQGAALEFP